MKTSYINNCYRAGVSDNCLFIFNDKEDSLIMKITNIIPSSKELESRGFDSFQEFYDIEILPMMKDELQLETINIGHLFD